MSLFKSTLVQVCRQQLENKVRTLNEAMLSLSESASQDSKSTAGDKHETSRAMVQLEQERTGLQLKEAEQQLSEFHRIDFQKISSSAVVGSLVHTDKGYFLIALALGRLNVEGHTVFVISVQSPLGKALSGAASNDDVTFNGVSYRIVVIT